MANGKASLREASAEHEAKSTIPRAPVHEDAPETPAHQFVVRAFKHAIWGTPAPGETERKPRRRDYDTSRSRTSADVKDLRTTPRRLAQSRSTSALNSPTKGILLTPGTANNRRKSVSWLPKENGGRAQTDSHARAQVRPIKQTPRHFPGYFPTPIPTKDQNQENREENRDSQSKQQTKIRSKNMSDKMKNTTCDQDASSPRREAEALLGNLRIEFEEYKSRSEREMRKLIAREKMAMDYARHQEAKLVEARSLLIQNEPARNKQATRIMALQQHLVMHGIKSGEEQDEVDVAVEGVGSDYRRLHDFTASKCRLGRGSISYGRLGDTHARSDENNTNTALARQQPHLEPPRHDDLGSDVFLDTAQAGSAATRRHRISHNEAARTAAADQPLRARQPNAETSTDSDNGARPRMRGGGCASSKLSLDAGRKHGVSPLRHEGSSPRKPLAETSANEAQPRPAFDGIRPPKPRGCVEQCGDAVPRLRGDGAATAAGKQERPKRTPQLPSDRLEAAKARIAQRNASKGKVVADAA